MALTIPDVPVLQPIVYKNGYDSQVSGEIVGALDEYYFISYSINEVTMWRITSKSTGALAAATRAYPNVWFLACAANDKGDVVVVYRGVSGNFSMDILTHEKSSLIARTVTLSGSSTISAPDVYVTMDGLEVVLIDNTDEIHKRAWGFTMDGQWAWDVIPPTQEYPYKGTWLSFPRQQRGLWVNSTVASWTTVNSPTMTSWVPDEPNHWEYLYQWDGANEETWGYPPNEVTASVPRPWLIGETEQWGGVRAVAPGTWTIDVPDIAHGYLLDGSHWDTEITVEHVYLTFQYLWGIGRTYMRYGTTVGSYLYNQRKAANGPNVMDFIVNGTSQGSAGVTTYVNGMLEPYNNFEFMCTAQAEIDLPAPGTYTFTADMVAGWPTTDQQTAFGLVSSMFPQTGGWVKYNYNPADRDWMWNIIGPGEYIYYATPDWSSFSEAHYPNSAPGGTDDRWDSHMGWVYAGAWMSIVYDSSDRQGGYTELRDMAGGWVPPRNGSTYLDRISNDTLALRGIPNRTAVGDMHPFHWLDDDGQGGE